MINFAILTKTLQRLDCDNANLSCEKYRNVTDQSVSDWKDTLTSRWRHCLLRAAIRLAMIRIAYQRPWSECPGRHKEVEREASNIIVVCCRPSHHSGDSFTSGTRLEIGHVSTEGCNRSNTWRSRVRIVVVNYQNYDYGARLAFGTSIEYSAPCDELIITSDLKIVISPVNYSLQLIKTPVLDSKYLLQRQNTYDSSPYVTTTCRRFMQAAEVDAAWGVVGGVPCRRRWRGECLASWVRCSWAAPRGRWSGREPSPCWRGRPAGHSRRGGRGTRAASCYC